MRYFIGQLMLICLIVLFINSKAQEGELVRKFPGDNVGSIVELKIDPSGVGYASSSCDHLLYTHDNGDNWTTIEIPNWVSVFREIAIKPGSGGMEAIALSDDQLLKTTNGGESWTNYNPNNVGVMQSISYFPNGNQILLSDNQTYSTSDGNNWIISSIDSPTGEYSIIETADNETIYAFAPYGFVATSTDGGVSWTEKTSVPGAYGGTPLYQVIDHNTCFVSRFPHLYKTSDGGDTWETYISNVPATPFTFISENELYFYSVWNVFRTTDKGMNYVEYEYPLGEGHIYPIVGSDSKEMWTSNSNGAIRHTSDLWTTWEEQVSIVNISFKDIIFKDAEIGVATGDKGTIYSTTDGGDHWTAVDLPNGNSVKDVAVGPSGAFFFAIEEPNVLYRSTDLIAFAEVKVFDDEIEFIAANELNVIVQTKGRLVYLSQNDGADWTVAHSFSKTTRAIGMQGDVVMIAGSGILDISKDGGVTWADYNEADFGSIWGVQVFDALTYYLMTSNVFFITTDGGESWEEKSRPAGGREIAMIDSKKGFLFATDGTFSDVFWTENGGDDFSQIHSSCIRYNKMYLNTITQEPFFVGGAAVIENWTTDVSVGITKKSIDNQLFRVFPNPSSKVVRLELSNINLNDARVEVYNLHGELIKLWSEIDQSTLFNVEDLSHGLYLVRLLNENQFYATKLFVE